jgi:nucleoside-diphosphate-sugar epimerase
MLERIRVPGRSVVGSPQGLLPEAPTDPDVRNSRVAELIGGVTVNIPPRPGDALHTLADNREAMHVLGWRPEVVFEDGLADLVLTKDI